MMKQLALAMGVATILSACGSVNPNPLSAKISDIQAVKMAELREELGSEVDGAQYTFTINGDTYRTNSFDGRRVNLSNYFDKDKVTDVEVTHRISKTVDGTEYYVEQDQAFRGYRQNYSLIAGYQQDGALRTNIEDLDIAGDDEVYILAKGETTAETALPKTGTYNYSGAAFTENDTDGKLSYDVNFDARKGSGSITGLSGYGTITLGTGDISSISHTNSGFDNSKISAMGISAAATAANGQTGTYTLGFFGPNAEEIVGSIDVNNESVVGFGGKRGNAAQ